MYGQADIDQTHILTINYTYALPALSKVAPSPVVSAVFDNWAISGITSFSTGTPTNASLSLSDNADLLGGGDPWPAGSSPARVGRPNLIGDPAISDRGFAQMFDPTVFARPGAGDPGNMGRSLIRNGGINNWDLSVYKIFPLGSERRNLQFRWEFYNAFNHAQFSGMNTTATFNSAGTMTNSRLAEATSARTGRVMQASLRIVF